MTLINYNKSYEDFIDKYQSHLESKGISLDKEQVKLVVDSLSDTLLDVFQESPTVYVKPIGVLSVALLAKRNRVLRGVEYASSTRYKIRLSMEKEFYDSIHEIYNKYLEDEE